MTSTPYAPFGGENAMIMPFGLEPMLSITRRMVAASAATQGHMLSHMKALHDEIYGFADERLGKDGASARRLGAACLPDEVVSVWGEFWATAVGDYARESSRLVDLYARTFLDTMRDVEHRADPAREG